MAKFHVNNKGTAGACSAVKGNCPYGGSEEHYETAEEAREAYEKQMNASTFNNASTLVYSSDTEPTTQVYKMLDLETRWENAATGFNNEDFILKDAVSQLKGIREQGGSEEELQERIEDMAMMMGDFQQMAMEEGRMRDASAYDFIAAGLDDLADVSKEREEPARCYVCNRNTDHFAEHDGLVEAGLATYDANGSVRKTEAWDDEKASKINKEEFEKYYPVKDEGKAKPSLQYYDSAWGGWRGVDTYGDREQPENLEDALSQAKQFSENSSMKYRVLTTTEDGGEAISTYSRGRRQGAKPQEHKVEKTKAE